MIQCCRRPRPGRPGRAVGSLGADGAGRWRWGGEAASEEKTSEMTAETVGRRPEGEHEETEPDRGLALTGGGDRALGSWASAH